MWLQVLWHFPIKSWGPSPSPWTRDCFDSVTEVAPFPGLGQRKPWCFCLHLLDWLLSGSAPSGNSSQHPAAVLWKGQAAVLWKGLVEVLHWTVPAKLSLESSPPRCGSCEWRHLHITRAQPLKSPGHPRAETSHFCYVLSKFLTHWICKHNKGVAVLHH